MGFLGLRKLIPFMAVYSLTFSSPSLAKNNDFSITDGMGEQLQVKHSLFGKKKSVIKDRFGDGFGQAEGLLGGKTSEVSLLGNHVQKKKGILGNSEIVGSSVFGDKFVTKKGIFGKRKTAIDLSGSSHLLQSFIGHPGPANAMPPMTQQRDMIPSMQRPQSLPESTLPRSDYSQSEMTSSPSWQSNMPSPAVRPSSGGKSEVNVNGDSVYNK